MFYRRNLPHWQPDTATVFITAHVAGSLPARAMCQLRGMQEDLDSGLEASRRLFAWYERNLDDGPETVRPFADPRAAAVVEASIQAEHGVSCHVLAWVVMPNHMHLLIGPLADRPLEPTGLLMRRIKGRSAYEVNRMAGRSGRLWQAESFDRWIRNDGNLDNTIRYIEQNPVAARLCRSPQEWRWSSAWERGQDRGL